MWHTQLCSHSHRGGNPFATVRLRPTVTNDRSAPVIWSVTFLHAFIPPVLRASSCSFWTEAEETNCDCYTTANSERKYFRNILNSRGSYLKWIYFFFFMSLIFLLVIFLCPKSDLQLTEGAENQSDLVGHVFIKLVLLVSKGPLCCHS